MSALNDVAERNILDISVTRDTSHLEMSPLKDSALRNILDISVTRDTSQLEMSPLNDFALRNIQDIVLTLDTSHFEMLALNNVAEEKRSSMLSILDTSHSPICPCGPREHSPFGNISRHVRTASSKSRMFFGENAGAGGMERDWDRMQIAVLLSPKYIGAS